MASQGPNIAGAGANEVSGGYAWTNPGNITTADGIEALCSSLDGFASSDLLVATSFGFSIPTGATIDGIEATVNMRCNQPDKVIDGGIYARHGGTAVGTDQSRTSSFFWPEDPTDVTYGGASNTWGRTWTVAEVNASTFGLQVRGSNSSMTPSIDIGIDYIKMTVYYTAAGGAGNFVQQSIRRVKNKSILRR